MRYGILNCISLTLKIFQWNFFYAYGDTTGDYSDYLLSALPFHSGQQIEPLQSGDCVYK